MRHIISIGPPWWHTGEIVWDDVAGTVAGDISGDFTDRSILPDLDALISNAPATVGCPHGSLVLGNPAHDAADFLRCLLSVTASSQRFTLPETLASVTPTPFPVPDPSPSPSVLY